MRLIDAVKLAEELSKRVWYEREDEKQAVRIVKESSTVDAEPVVRCGECKYRYVDSDNVRFNLCLLNHNKVQSDDWYCADGRRKDTWEPNETDLKAMLDAGHETFVRVFSQDAKMDKEVESDG